MLSDSPVAATIPVKDVAAIRSFYEDQLGLKVAEERPEGILYDCAEGTKLFVFESSGASDGSFTQVSWECADIDAEVAELRSRGVGFEHYDMPGFSSDEHGLVDLGDGARGCWFKDPAGNLLALSTRMT